MAQPAPVMPPLVLKYQRTAVQEHPLRFECWLLEEQPGEAKRRSTTLMLSFAVHAVLVALVVVIPILTYNALPAPDEGARAFFVAPSEAAPPPPPPPPPPAGVRSLAKTAAAPTPPPTDSAFVSPVEVPDVIKPEQGLDLGVAGGVPGGVEGGVPGGIVGGIPPAAPPPPVTVVRIGGQIKAPKLVKSVPPVYPDLAVQAHLAAVIILEALVEKDGHVKSVTVLRGAPLFDDAAIEAVKQWRYQPLLLNGVPTEFILTVTVKFNLNAPQR